MCCYLDAPGTVILKPDHPIRKPIVFAEGIGRQWYLVVKAIEMSHVSGKARLYGSDLLSLSLYTKGSKL